MIIDLIKIGLIWMADLLTKICDPFEPFTRETELDRYYSLDEKAAIFETDLMHRDLIQAGTMWDYTYPNYSHVGDQALWHGVTTAMWALKGDLYLVKRCLIGLKTHQPNGRLIRGIDVNGLWQEDASNDQATGHLMGLYLAWKYGDRDIRNEAAILIHDWAINVLSHNHALVQINGKSTTYGQLINGWKTDPLRLTLCLAIYAAAYEMTGNPLFQRAIYDCEKYRLLLPYAKASFLWLDNKNDAWRAAVHYYILDDLGYYTKEVNAGKKRLYNITKKSGNCLVELLLRISKPNLTLLHEFGVMGKDNREKVVTDYDTFVWGGELSTRQPIPIWKRGGQDFMWQRNLYSAQNWLGNTKPSQWYNGVDFLICYHLAKRQGVI